MEFDVQELADVLGRTVFPEGYRLYDFAGGNTVVPGPSAAMAGGSYLTTRYVGIQRESDGTVRFLQIK